MSNEPAKKELDLRGGIICNVIVAILFPCCLIVFLGVMYQHERLSSFEIGPYTINVFAESNFDYDPPGYIYFELKLWGQTQIPERRFMGIGFERKPQESFTLAKTDDAEIVALVLKDEIQMIHEFSSGFTWPGPYTNVTESQWEIANTLLQKLRASNPNISCPRQEEYRKTLDRQKSK